MKDKIALLSVAAAVGVIGGVAVLVVLARVLG